MTSSVTRSVMCCDKPLHTVETPDQGPLFWMQVELQQQTGILECSSLDSAAADHTQARRPSPHAALLHSLRLPYEVEQTAQREPFHRIRYLQGGKLVPGCPAAVLPRLTRLHSTTAAQTPIGTTGEPCISMWRLLCYKTPSLLAYRGGDRMLLCKSVSASL